MYMFRKRLASFLNEIVRQKRSYILCLGKVRHIGHFAACKMTYTPKKWERNKVKVFMK